MVLLRVKLSNERKAYLAVLGLGVAALVVNQILPGSGSPASVAAAPTPAGNRGTADTAAGALPAVRQRDAEEVMSVAKRIEAMAAKCPVALKGDEESAFAPPATWSVKLAAYRPFKASGSEGQAEAPAGGFPTVRVTAVVLGNAGRVHFAQIVVPDSSGKPVARVFKVGEKVVGDVILESLYAGGAVLAAPGGVTWRFAVGKDTPEIQ